MKAAFSLILTILLLAGRAFAQSPVLFYTDIESGPNVGGENNQGAIVTLYGRNFGAAQNFSTVTIGGGQAAAYKLWSDTKVAVAIGPAAATGNIEVHTLAGDSNGLPFRVRGGKLYYVSGSGSDANNGSFASPWKTLLKARSLVAPGDTVYAMNGSDQTSDDGALWFSALTFGLNLTASGAPDLPISYVVYPGHSVTVGDATANGAKFGIRSQGDGVQYITIAGFHLVTGGSDSALTIGYGGDAHWRVIGNDMTCPNASNTGGCLFVGSDYTQAFGNEVHHSGITQPGSKLIHLIYAAANHLWIGWNKVHDSNNCRGIQVHNTLGPNNYDLHIFSNEVYNTRCDGIDIATIDPSKGVVEVFNNLIYHTGTGPIPSDNSASYGCIYSAEVTNYGVPGSGVAEIYNNTLYDCGSFSVFEGDNGGIVRSGINPNIVLRLRNNIVQLLPGERYVSSGFPEGYNAIVGDKNLWFGAGYDPPGFTNNLLVDPVFVSVPGKDFHLQAGSPAIDAGATIDTLLTDRDGNLRPYGASDDLGAYETRPPAADLTIRVTHSGNFLPSQSGAAYSIVVYNVGTGPSSGLVTVADALPPGLTGAGFGGTGWTCTLSPLACSRSDVLEANSSYPPIALTVNVSPAPLPNLSNSATVSGGGDQTMGNNTSNDPTVVSIPDMTVTKTHSGNFLQGDSGAVYRIIAANAGTGPTSGTVTVADILPPNLTATAMSGTGWNCALVTLACTRSDVLAAGASYPFIALTVSVSPSAPATLVNQATVSGGGEINSFDDTVRDLTIVVPASDLSILKSHTGNFFQGQSGASYTISVSNLGPNPTSGQVTVTDFLPSGLTATAVSGAGWNCILATLVCTRADALAVNASYASITVAVDVANNAPASATNVATVSALSESNAANNTANDATTVTQLPDLTISKSHTGDFFPGQQGAAYSIVVSNAGSAPTTGTVSVSDTLPAGLTAASISGAGWSCTLSTLSCGRNDALAANASYAPISVTVNVASIQPTVLVNVATVSGGGEFLTSNDAASDSTNIRYPTDLTITKTHSGNFFRGQAGALYTIVVSNVGSISTSGQVTVTEAPPAGLTVVSMDGSGWDCDVAALTCTRSDVLASTSDYPAITVEVNVGQDAPSSVSNTASVSGGGEQNAANNTASDVTSVVNLPDLSMFVTGTNVHHRGEPGVSQTLTVSNVGSAPTSGTVSVVASIPPGLIVTGLSGSGWICIQASLTCTTSDVLAAGASYPDIVVTSNVSLAAPFQLTVSAVASGGGDQWTPNNDDHTTLNILSSPDLAMSIPDVGALTLGQSGVSYALNIANLGYLPVASTATVTVSLSAGLTAASIGGAGWDCDLGALTCARSDALAALSSYPDVQVVCNVAPDAPSSVTLAASVDAAGDTYLTNNSDSVESPVN